MSVAAIYRRPESGSLVVADRERTADCGPSLRASTREREVLELIGEGLSNQAIAERLFVSQSAVEKHVSSIFDKLQLPGTKDTHRRVLAVLALLRH